MRSRRARIVLAFVVFSVLLAQALLYPGIDTLVTAIGVPSALDASMWFLAAEFAAFIAFAGVWGAMSDAAGRRRPFIVAGAVGGAMAYLLMAMVAQSTSLSFLGVLGLRILQGALTIGAFSLAMTMLMDLEGGHGRNMGAAGIAIGLGMSLGSPLGGQLYEIGPFVPLYGASGLLLGVGVLSVGLSDRTTPTGRETIGKVIETIRNERRLSVPYAYGFIDRFTAGFFALVGTLYFRTVFGLSPGATGIFLALFFVPFALLQYPFGILSDRIGRTGPVVAGSVLYGFGVLGVGLSPTPKLAGVMMAVSGVLGALMSPATMALVTDIAPATERGTAMAGFNVFGSAGFLAGILVGGTVASNVSFFAAFLTAAGAEIAIALLTLPILLRWH
ncbi:MAG: MFS transporter [Halodesulfurarchaeum sp.]|nr:MFS transporter [Halodesulfurarchaeum sp.]